MPNQPINIKNLNWLRSLKTVGPQGVIQGHLIAACFDDVSQAYSNLANTNSTLEARIEALEAAAKNS